MTSICDSLWWTKHFIRFPRSALTVYKDANMISVLGALTNLGDIPKHLILCRRRGKDLLKIEFKDVSRTFRNCKTANFARVGN